MTQYAYVFPGQGSQSVGMVNAWQEDQPAVDEVFRIAADSLGYDLLGEEFGSDATKGLDDRCGGLLGLTQNDSDASNPDRVLAQEDACAVGRIDQVRGVVAANLDGIPDEHPYRYEEGNPEIWAQLTEVDRPEDEGTVQDRHWLGLA